MQTIDFTLPAHWASALINGDFSGLSDEDAAAVRYFLDTEPDINGDCLTCTDEPMFLRYYDADGLACDCLTYTFPLKADANTLTNLLAGTAPKMRHRD
jgi:hypothetical protein